MLGDERGRMLKEYVSDYVLYDLETTGISSNYDEVIEISALKVRAGEIVAEFSELVNPGISIPYSASVVNNITDEMVATAPCFDEVLERFIEFIGDDILVGHNINNFDNKFIYRDCEKYFGKTLTNDYIDTLILAKKCFPQMKHRRLSDLADVYGISTKGAHRALADCKMNQQIFENLGKELDGVETEKPGLKICPRCGLQMTQRNGMYGMFWGCAGYPRCRYTENIK